MRRSRKPNGSTPNAGRKNWATLDPQEWERIARIYEAGSKSQFVQEAAQLGTNIEVLGRQVRSYRLVERKLQAKYLAAALPESPSPVYDEFTVVKTRDAIISDIEVPDHSTFMFKAALLTGMRYGIRTSIWAGDLAATDQEALNTWATTWKTGRETVYSFDIKILKKLITTYGRWFNVQEGCIGNHDLRPAKLTGGEITLDMLLEPTGFQLGDYSYLYLFNPDNQEWTYVGHGFKSGRNNSGAR